MSALPKIQGPFYPEELGCTCWIDQAAILAVVSRYRPKVFIEIGVNEGSTARLILREFVCIERYIGIDVPDNKLAGRLVDDPRFELMLRRNGYDSPLSLPRADAIFVDGDHSVLACQFDTDLAHSLVNPGGVIFWHDYGSWSADVNSVLESERAKGRELVHVQGTDLAVEIIR